MGSDGFYKLTRGQNSSEQSCEIYSLLQWSQKNQQKASEVSLNIAYAWDCSDLQLDLKYTDYLLWWLRYMLNYKFKDVNEYFQKIHLISIKSLLQFWIDIIFQHWKQNHP